MKIDELKKYKKILILGYGVEGKATHEFLKKYHPAAVIGIADKQTQGESYLELQKEYDLAIKSPGINKSKLTIPYTTATNIFFANVKGVTIGITGSKGKSTTSTLIYSILKDAGKTVYLVGNITHKMALLGRPMLAGLLETNKKDDIWVIELSSYMLDDILYSPHISVITSFFLDHLDYHETRENYLQAKSQLISFAKSKDYYIYNPNFLELRQFTKMTQAKCLPFMSDLPFPATDILLLGEHNKDNVKGAVTTAILFGIPSEVISHTIKSFRALPHRLENVGTYHGITFYDDAISTTPESTIAALESLEHVGTLFLGGYDRGYTFDTLADTIIQKGIPNLVFFPTTGEKIYEKLVEKIHKSSLRYQPKILQTKSMEEAVQFAFENTKNDWICLLSTASPSYSLWKNFEEKGNLFKEAVRKLGN